MRAGLIVATLGLTQEERQAPASHTRSFKSCPWTFPSLEILADGVTERSAS